MKKSNIYLLSGIIVAIIWTTLTGVWYSVAINRDLEGKATPCIITHTQRLEKSKQIFPSTENMLIISGDTKNSIILKPGKELTVKTLPSNATVTFKKLKNDIPVISMSGPGQTNESIYITIPAIKKLKFKNLSHVYVTGFNEFIPVIEMSNVSGFSAEKSTLAKLVVEVLHKVDVTAIEIESSCAVDSLTVIIPGKGNLKLGARAKYENKLVLSDSVNVESAFMMLKSPHENK